MWEWPLRKEGLFFFVQIVQFYQTVKYVKYPMKTLLSIGLLMAALPAMAQLSSPGVHLTDNKVRKVNHTLRSASNPKDCGSDTVEYVRYKTTQFNSVSVRRGSSLGQFYPAPQTMTITGFSFYGWALQTTPARAYTIRLICNLYKAGADSLPSGAPVASDTVTVDTTFGGGMLAVLEKFAVFKKPVTLDYPYILTVETDSVNVAAGVVSNSWQNRNGRGENLLCGSVSGLWYRGLSLNIGGTTLDADMAFYPFVSVKLGTDFTVNYSCYPLTDSVRFTNQSRRNVVGSRVYDWYTYNNLERFNHMWNPGVNPFQNFNSVNFIWKYTARANYDVRLITTHRRWTAGSCVDTTIHRIYFLPVNPTLSGKQDVCKGDTLVLRASGDAGVEMRWYRTLSDTTAFQTGAEYRVENIQKNDTVYVQAWNNHCRSSRVMVAIRVGEYPDDPQVRNDSICSGSRANLSASTNVGTIEWYMEISGGKAFHFGDVYSTGILQTDTTLYVVANNGNCMNKGGRIPVTAFVGSQFAPDAPLVSSDTQVCLRSASAITLIAKQQSSGTLRWFNQASGGTALVTGDTFRFTPTQRREYNWYVDNFNGVCASTRMRIRVDVADYPNVSSSSGSVVCDGDSLTYQVSVPFGTTSWYNSATGGSALHMGNIFRTKLSAGNHTYYAETSSGVCVSPTRTAVAGTVNAPPALTNITAPVVCSRSVAVINANTTFGIVRWFDDPDATQPIATGNTFTTPMLLGSFTYYAESEFQGCKSGRVPVLVRVNPRPAAGFTWVLNWQRRITCTPISTTGVSSFWDFGDGTTSTANVGVHTYAANGTYTVRLIQTNLSNGCKDTADIPVAADHTGVRDYQTRMMNIFPNPVKAGDRFAISDAGDLNVLGIRFADMSGRIVYTSGISGQNGRVETRIPASLTPGIYIMNLVTDRGNIASRIQVD